VKEFILPPEQKSIFTFKHIFEPQHTYGKMVLENHNFEFEVSVRGFGYHIETKDIERRKFLNVQKRFVYLRTGDETLMKIYEKNQKEILKTIPIHNRSEERRVGKECRYRR